MEDKVALFSVRNKQEKELGELKREIPYLEREIELLEKDLKRLQFKIDVKKADLEALHEWKIPQAQEIKDKVELVEIIYQHKDIKLDAKEMLKELESVDTNGMDKYDLNSLNYNIKKLKNLIK